MARIRCPAPGSAAAEIGAELKRSVGADTIVTVKSGGDVEALGAHLVRTVRGANRMRVAEDRVELHVEGTERILPRVVEAADEGGFDIIDLSVTEPTLETVFINLTGKELRE